MRAVVTTVHNGTRFYITDDGFATDIPGRAGNFNYSYDAQNECNRQNLDSRQWLGIKWHVSYMLSDGSVTEQNRHEADKYGGAQ